MSTGLMSCVRENSPPLEMAGNDSSGAISLSGNASVSDQQKRRRFHPLRNLRRIFRRRTLTAVDTITTVQSVSSPSSPSSSQLSSTPTVIASVPAHNINKLLSYGSNNPLTGDVITMSSAAYPPSHFTNLSRVGGINGTGGNSSINHHHHDIQQIVSNTGTGDGDILCGNSGNSNRGFCDRYGGVPVMLPPFSAYNIQEINNSNCSRKTDHNNSEMTTILKGSDSGNDDIDDAREMTDYQRSFSEGRLVDGDLNREALSQSHDSVFSESATASSLSIVLKAELFDVLRKRRNRPDASDEDLGLPRSPTTPQRKDQTMNNNQSEVSSLSLLSMASSDLDDESSSNYASGCGGGGTNANCSGSGSHADKTNSSISSKLSLDTSKTSDELDFAISSDTRLSHSAARHKMAIRPKKKGPTRHRRPIESTVLPATPEVNEDMVKSSFADVGDSINNINKSQSLPSGTNANVMEDHNSEITNEILANNGKTEKHVTSSSSSVNLVKNVNKNYCVESDYLNCGSSNSTLEKKDESFFRRLLHRNSKKMKKQQDEVDIEENISTENKKYIEQYTTFENSEEYNQKIEETRKEIRKEILSEAKSSLSPMLNTFILSADHDKDVEFDREQELMAKINKPKSGPAARQRILPKDLSKSPLPEIKNPEKTIPVSENIQQEESSSQIKHRLKNTSNMQESPVKYFKFSNDAISSALENIQTQNHSKSQQSVDEVNSSRLIKSYTCLEDSFKTSSEHFEKKERLQPKIIGLSPFQQKISRADISTLDHGRPIPKQRKSVEKSKSFRYYSEGADNQNENNLKKHENMPSLPDLSFSKQKTSDISNEPDFMPLSLSFEINDNNLLKRKRQNEQLPLSQGIYTKNIILTTSKPSPIGTKPVINSCCQNITEIEENIDKLVKSPFVTVLRKSTSNGGETTEQNNGNGNVNISTASVRKTDSVITEKVSEKTVTTITSLNTDNNNYKILNDTKALSTENLNKIEFKSKDRVGSMDMIERKSIEKLESTESLIAKVDLRNKEKKSVCSLSSNALKVRRNSSVLEKFENGNQIPEFMKIQLNRVDPVRPKSNIVLAKNVKETEDKEIVRRFSNENVEISDNKPPLPSCNVSTTSQSPTDDIPKSPARKVDDDNNILRNSENTQINQIYERKKSVTDEKLKYEKKIEELRSEWKKQYSEENERLTPSRKVIGSGEDENVVVLRKKSFAFNNNNQSNNNSNNNNNNNNNNKEDTPELMKVFARRSLKLKDEEMQTFEEIEKMNSLKKLSRNLDSDKENQSSSEEKLDKLPKVEVTIQQQKMNASSCSKIDDKCRNSSMNDLLRKPNSTLITSSMPTKSYISPIRYSSIVGYRNQSNFNSKSQVNANHQTLTTPATSSSTSTLSHNEQNNNIVNNNNNNTNTNANNNNININNNNALNKRGLRHTIGPLVHNTSAITESESGGDVGEFKGILQRRAEWEKRAKEALK